MPYPMGYAVKLDSPGGGVQYVGYAKPGTASAAASWAIMKITTSGANLVITWDSGDSVMSHVWDNRAGDSYS